MSPFAADTKTFAIVGTLISAFVVGSLVYAVGDGTSVPLTFVDSVVLGSLLAAVDPVSAIAVFKQSGVNIDLYTLVFGESVVNDAVSIVVTRYDVLRTSARNCTSLSN